MARLAVSSWMWLALTLWVEARGEPELGKLAVANVVMNRATRRNMSVGEVVLQPYQFSGWNSSDARMALAKIDENDPAWHECCMVAHKALSGQAEDVSKGADHYLNIDVTVRSRGSLPNWFREDRVTVKINRHTFLNLEGDMEGGTDKEVEENQHGANAANQKSICQVAETGESADVDSDSDLIGKTSPPSEVKGGDNSG